MYGLPNNVRVVSDPSVHISGPSIGFVYDFVFKSLRDGSQVFALLMLFLCVIVRTMWSGKCLQLLYASYPFICSACLPSV